MFKKLYCCQSSAKAGVEEEKELIRRFSFDVSPNPAVTSVRVTFGDRVDERDARLRIIGSSGEMVSERVIPREAREMSIDVSMLSPGAYIFEVIRSGFVFSRKLMIQR